MKKEHSKMFNIKVVLRIFGSVVYAFLFSFCTLSNILTFSINMPVGDWILPIFVLPANLVCMTFGIGYWIGDDPVRRWSYCVSTIALTALLMYMALELEFTNGRSTLLGLIAAILLPMLPVLYNIRLICKRPPVIQEANTASPTIAKHNARIWLQATIRVLCMLSICCVLFVSWQRRFHFSGIHLRFRT